MVRNNGKNRKVKLCHVVNKLDIGGMENGVINICNNIDREKFIPMICCLNDIGAMASRLKSDVKVVNLKFMGKNSPLNVKKVFQTFVKSRVDIVHTHGWGGGSIEGIVGARLARVPIVINGEHGSFFEKWYQILIQRILFNLCDANVAVSFSLREQLSKSYKLPREGITVIVNGVDSDKFSGNYSKQVLVRRLIDQGFSVTLDRFTIVSVGSLKREKNQELLLKAFAIGSRTSYPKAMQLLFVGDGPDRNKLKKLVNRYSLEDKVFFLGNRDDVPEILSFSDVLVSTSVSYHEGMSNVILEAMCSGLPVIATMSVGASELIKEGENGFLIMENDVLGLSCKIDLLRHKPDLAHRIGNRAREMVKKQYSIATMVENYENLYLDIFYGKQN